MRKAHLVRLLFVRMALVLPLGRLIGPRLLGLALGTWPRLR